jgi:hypothetical protein
MINRILNKRGERLRIKILSRRKSLKVAAAADDPLIIYLL